MNHDATRKLYLAIKVNPFLNFHNLPNGIITPIKQGSITFAPQRPVEAVTA
jgi:hypothetical protein